MNGSELTNIVLSFQHTLKGSRAYWKESNTIFDSSLPIVLPLLASNFGWEVLNSQIMVTWYQSSLT